MRRRAKQAGALALALAGSLLVEAGGTRTVPREPAPAVALVPAAAPSPVPDQENLATPALAAVTDVGTVAVLTRPARPPVTFGTTADVLARAGVGTWAAGAVDQPFPTASLVKLYLAEGVLAGHRAAGTAVPAADLARIDAMLTSSDDPPASELWVAYDGPAVLADVVTRYGLTGTTAPTPDPGAWGQAHTTARDLGTFLTDLRTVAHPADAALLLAALARATPAGADGFDQSFGLLRPGAERAAVKQGWMCCVDDLRHLHSVGVVGDRVVVLLAEFPAGVDWPAARAALDAAAEELSR